MENDSSKDKNITAEIEVFEKIVKIIELQVNTTEKISVFLTKLTKSVLGLSVVVLFLVLYQSGIFHYLLGMWFKLSENWQTSIFSLLGTFAVAALFYWLGKKSKSKENCV